MAKVQESRFAAFMDDDKKHDKKKNKKPQQNQQPKHQDQKQANKKNKKKGKESQNNPPSSERPHLSSINSDGSVNENTNNRGDWQQWLSRDTEFTDENYEKDLQEALLLSKLEIEENKQAKKAQKTSENGKQEESNRKKKKKVMSLEQFNTTDHEKKEIEKTESPEPITPIAKIHPHKANDKYFDKVEDDVSKIIRKEKIQEDYKKHYAHESVMASKYQEELEKRDSQLEALHQKYEQLAEEHKKVKKRNKQLCFILAEGEMKDKTEVLLQVEELSAVKDELTEQVSQLTAELEKERSKVHTMKSEVDKLKGGKGGR